MSSRSETQPSGDATAGSARNREGDRRSSTRTPAQPKLNVALNSLAADRSHDGRRSGELRRPLLVTIPGHAIWVTFSYSRSLALTCSVTQ